MKHFIFIHRLSCKHIMKFFKASLSTHAWMVQRSCSVLQEASVDVAGQGWRWKQWPSFRRMIKYWKTGKFRQWDMHFFKQLKRLCPLSRWLLKGIWRELVGMAISDGKGIKIESQFLRPGLSPFKSETYFLFLLDLLYPRALYLALVITAQKECSRGRKWRALCSRHLHHCGGGGHDLQILCLLWIYTAWLFPQPISTYASSSPSAILQQHSAC